MITPSKYYAIKDKYHKCHCEQFTREWASKEFKDAGIHLFRDDIGFECVACKIKRVKK